MKKLITLALSALMILSLAGCAGTNPEPTPVEPENVIENGLTQGKDMDAEVSSQLMSLLKMIRSSILQ